MSSGQRCANQIVAIESRVAGPREHRPINNGPDGLSKHRQCVTLQLNDLVSTQVVPMNALSRVCPEGSPGKETVQNFLLTHHAVALSNLAWFSKNGRSKKECKGVEISGIAC